MPSFQLCISGVEFLGNAARVIFSWTDCVTLFLLQHDARRLVMLHQPDNVVVKMEQH